MLARLLRQWSPRLLHPLIRMLIAARITPNQLTVAGLALEWAAGLLVAVGQPVLAGSILLLSGLLDALDGELARQSGRATPFGAFCDSIADHYGDVAVYVGIAWAMLRAGDSSSILLV